MSAKIPYRSPETPVAPRLRWTIRTPEGDGAQVAFGVSVIALAAGWVADGIVFAISGLTPAVSRGLLVLAVATGLFCALFVRRAPEV